MKLFVFLQYTSENHIFLYLIMTLKVICVLSCFACITSFQQENEICYHQDKYNGNTDDVIYFMTYSEKSNFQLHEIL